MPRTALASGLKFDFRSVSAPRTRGRSTCHLGEALKTDIEAQTPHLKPLEGPRRAAKVYLTGR